jgi:hypothetical protein
MMKILRLSKQEKILEEHEEKMIRAGLNSLDELDELETREQQEKHEEETRREAQLPVSTSEISAPAGTP